MYAPSAISARGGKFRFLPGVPGYVTVSVEYLGHLLTCLQGLLSYFYEQPAAIDDPSVIIEQFRQAAVNAKAAGFNGVERKCNVL